MARLLTKADREKVMFAITEGKAKNGYTLETYKGLKIFSKHDTERSRYYLEIYRDQSTKPICNYYYTEPQLPQMLSRIETTKSGYDRAQTWKEERKESNKGKRITGAAACADAIREELKKLYPDTKFSVRSETFSMGDAVRVSWVDGQTTKEIDAILSKYQDGYFDGMQDMYVHTHKGDTPSAKYITTGRTMSEETGAAIKADAERLYTENIFGCRDVSQFIYQIFSASSIPAGAKITGLTETGATCGSYPHELYKIAFEETEQAEKVERPAAVEVPADEVQIIEYSEKAIAVIGNTYPIREKLKGAGGKFNKFLTCGAGWIFQKTKLEALQNLLSAPEPTEAETLPTVIEPQEQPTTLKDEIRKTVEFFAETDLKLYGEITEGTREAARVQRVELPEVKQYETIEAITEAAESGEVVSLLNLYELVNPKTRANV
jgi:hypothetical protein